MPRRRAMAALALLAVSCSSGDLLDRQIARLDDSDARERAIDGLLRMVREAPEEQRPRIRERVVDALMVAYRADHKRGQIVAALGSLGDPRAGEVFVAALNDSDRGGSYFEAAVRSARLIGELRLERYVPALVTALERAHAAPRQDRNTWLERSLIQALARFGDRRAVDVLIKVLRGDPVEHDFYLNKLAAAALGRIGDPRGVGPLIESLGATSHGLLLFEDSRQALCRIGEAAVEPLIAAAGRRDARGRLVTPATGAAAVLGDVAPAAAAEGITRTSRPQDPAAHRLAVALTLTRLEHERGPQLLVALAEDGDTPLTERRRALELLGWYGGLDAATPQVDRLCRDSSPAAELLCLAATLALSRSAPAAAGAHLDKLLAQRPDRATQNHGDVYRRRLEVLSTCTGDRACLLEKLGSNDWRVQERAALELGRVEEQPVALNLARQLKGAHPQVVQAILVVLERHGSLTDAERPAVESLLRQFADASGAERPPAELRSWSTCIAERLRRASTTPELKPDDEHEKSR